MFFRNNHIEQCWRGLLHAAFVLFYLIFISIIYLSVTPLFAGVVHLLVQIVFGLFVTVLSVAICAYFIFFEPMKLIMHHHFKAATMLLLSTLGWLFIFLITFVLGFMLVVTPF